MVPLEFFSEYSTELSVNGLHGGFYIGTEAF